MIGRSVWPPNGIASIWKRQSRAQMGSRWSSSPTIKATSWRLKRPAWRCTNVKCIHLPSSRQSWRWSMLVHVTKIVFSFYILVDEYIKSLTGNPELVDCLALSNDDKVGTTVQLYAEINLVPYWKHYFCLSPTLLPVLRQNEITSSKVLFPEHLPLSKVQAGIKSGSFLQGTFRASRDNYLEATVFVQGEGEDSTEVGMDLS